MNNVHAYVCECPERRCRERIRITPARYRELSAIGNVVSPDCACDLPRTVRLEAEDAVVVRSRLLERLP